MTLQAFLQSGQSTCHDENGNKISCNGSGQDAEFKKGLTWPDPRFKITGALVQDQLTGLVWSHDANPAEYPMTWLEALDWIKNKNQQGAHGFHDWRLPNRHELRSLISHQTRRPALPVEHPFINVFPGWYWTSTTAVISPSHAWYVDMDGGRMFYGGKDQSFLFWPVRGNGKRVLPVTGQYQCYSETGKVIPCEGSGQDGELRHGVIWPTPRFAIDGEMVIDQLTLLCWTRVADIGPGPLCWEEALAAVRTYNERNIQSNNWRLPNINELESLVDCSSYEPALPSNYPFTDLQDVYWSSTTSLYEPDWAWALYLDKGAIGVGQKNHARFHVWAVCDFA